MFDKDMRKRLISIIESHPESGRYYSSKIGIAPGTLRSYLNETGSLNLKAKILIKKFVEKEEKKL